MERFDIQNESNKLNSKFVIVSGIFRSSDNEFEEYQRIMRDIESNKT